MLNDTGTSAITRADLEHLPALIDASTAAQLTGFSSHYVTDLCARGKIAGVKVGRRWRINTAALLDQFGLGE